MNRIPPTAVVLDTDCRGQHPQEAISRIQVGHDGNMDQGVAMKAEEKQSNSRQKVGPTRFAAGPVVGCGRVRI